MNATAYGLFRFLTELLPAASIFAAHSQRRAGFWWKLLLCLAVCFTASGLSGHMAQDAPFLAIARYILLFLLAAGLIHVCYDLSWYGALFCAVSAYAVQHFTSKPFYLFQRTVNPELGLEILLYLLHTLLWYGLFYLILGKRMKNQDYTRLTRWELLALCGAVMLCTVVLSVVSGEYSAGIPFGMNFAATCYAMMCCLLILTLQFGIFQRGQLQGEMEWMERLWAQERKQYEISRENMNLISIKCHDMKHVLNSLEPRLSKQERADLSGMINLYDTAVKTGCEVLDVLLAEKSVLCSQRKISMTCMADGGRLDFMQKSDLYSLFGNLMDNAIEAVSRLEDEEKRVISIVVTCQKGAVLIHAENYYQGELQMENGLPVTRKEDRDYHGFGMKSIRLIAEKYQGTLVCGGADGLFHLDILLPLPEASV